MIEIEKLAERILDEIEGHTASINVAISRELATPDQLRATLIALIERHLKAVVAETEPLYGARKYRVWFDAWSALGPAPYCNLPGNQNLIILTGITKEGVPIEAYSAEDCLTQAKMEIPYLLKDHPGAPFQIAIHKIAPDRKALADASRAELERKQAELTEQLRLTGMLYKPPGES